MAIPVRTRLLAVLALLCVPLIAFAQPVPPPHADHLRLATPLPVESPPDAVEVVALFWYGCPHCFALEPELKKWAATQPADVRVRKMPAVLTRSWEPAAQLFYTMEALGRADTLHQAIFDAEHSEGSLQVQSRDEQKFADWAEKKGIVRKSFLDAWNSQAVSTRVDRASQLTLQFRRIGVPALIVDGRILTTTTQAGTPQAMLATVDRLIAEVRAERRSK